MHSLILFLRPTKVSALVAFDESLLNTFKKDSLLLLLLCIIWPCSCVWIFKHFGASQQNNMAAFSERIKYCLLGSSNQTFY